MHGAAAPPAKELADSGHEHLAGCWPVGESCTDYGSAGHRGCSLGAALSARARDSALGAQVVDGAAESVDKPRSAWTERGASGTGTWANRLLTASCSDADATTPDPSTR